MANISSIKLPNGTTYNLKDTVSGYTTNTGTITKIQTTAGAHTTVNVSSGAVTFNVPTKTSHLTNDSGFLTSHQDISGKIDTAGTGLSKSGTTLNHTNSVMAQTTQAVYPIKIDAQGHISAYGSAVTIPTIPSNNVTGSGTTNQLAQWSGTNTLTNGPKITYSTSTPSGGSNGDIWFVYS